MLKKFYIILLFLPFLALSAEAQLTPIGVISCINPKTNQIDAEYEILYKSSPQIRNTYLTNILLGNYQRTTELRPVKLASIIQATNQYLPLVQVKSGICKKDDFLTIKLTQTLDNFALLLQLSKIFNLKYSIDGNTLYIPTYYLIYNERVPSYDVFKTLVAKIKRVNPWLDITVSLEDKILKVSGNIYSFQQLTKTYGQNYLSKILSSSEGGILNTGGSPQCPATTNYVDLCYDNNCDRYILSISENSIKFIPYSQCYPQKANKLKFTICNNRAPVSSLYLDNIDLETLLKIFEKLLGLHFIYDSQDLKSVKNSSNLHLVFRCLDRKKALEFLRKNFHLYLQKIDSDTYRIFKSKDNYSLVLQKVANYETKVVYLRNITTTDFINLIQLYYANQVEYAADPTFNAVTLIGPAKTIKEILTKFKVYIRNTESFDSLMTKIFYVKYGDPQELVKKMETYLSDKGSIKVLDIARAIEVTDYPTNISMIEKVFGGFLSQKPIKIKVITKFVQIQKTFSRVLGFNWNLNYPRTIAGKAFSFNATFSATNNLQIVSSLIYRKINPLNLILSAGETSGLAKTLSSPSLILLNGQHGTISQGTQIPYQSVDQNGNPTTRLVAATLTLDVTPTLLPDGRILLQLQLSRNSPNTAITVNGQPAINTFTVTQDFILANGESIVIGGVLERTNQTGETGVPYLMRIPLLGWLFKTKNWSKQDTELLVIVTAKVVNH